MNVVNVREECLLYNLAGVERLTLEAIHGFSSHELEDVDDVRLAAGVDFCGAVASGETSPSIASLIFLP